MEIFWYGYACFRLRDRGIAIVTDPYDDSVGYQPPRLRAEVVTVSHPHPSHSNVRAVRGRRKVFGGPGEYEIQGVFITGISTYHDQKKGEERGTNTIFLFDFGGVSVCHLGSLGHTLTQAQTELLRLNAECRSGCRGNQPGRTENCDPHAVSDPWGCHTSGSGQPLPQGDGAGQAGQS